jgi:hypothetical protein
MSARPARFSVEPTESDESELAVARLEWARAAGCVHLPSQQDAWRWHLAQCDDAADSTDAETLQHQRG